MVAASIPSAVQVPLPSMVDDEFLDSGIGPSAVRPDGRSSIVAFFIKTLELYSIVNDILLELYQPVGDEESKGIPQLVAVLQLDHRLLHWSQSLPEHLKYSSSPVNEGLLYQRQRVVLHARYVLFLHE